MFICYKSLMVDEFDISSWNFYYLKGLIFRFKFYVEFQCNDVKGMRELGVYKRNLKGV